MLTCYKSILIFLFSLLISHLSFAGDAKINLVLKTITVISTSEYISDEVYFDVSVKESDSKHRFKRIPPKPYHWPTKALSKLQNLSLWQDVIESKETALITLSLIEKDAPPWNLDDLIDSISFHFANDNKGIKVLVYKDSQVKLRQFNLKKGDDISFNLEVGSKKKGRYMLKLQLKQNE